MKKNKPVKMSQHLKLVYGMVIVCSLVAIGCGAQGDQKNKNYEIAKKSGFLKDYVTKYKTTIENLRGLNPKIKGDSVNKRDTVFFAAAAPLPPKVIKDEYTEEPIGKSGLFREVKLNGKEYLICEINPHQYKIEAFNRVQNKGEYNFASLARDKKKELIFIMNGGMFEKDLSPVGLFIADGKTYTKINLRKGSGNFYELPPNAVFLLDSNENPMIVKSELFSEEKFKPVVATQSGPMLVVDGLINPKFTQGSDNLNIRNGVGINKKNNVVFVISYDPVNFYEFARLFREKLGCTNALYLDGVVSESYIPELDPAPKQDHQLGVFLTVSQRTQTDGKKVDNADLPPEKGASGKKKSKKP